MLIASLAFAAWFGRQHGKQFALGAGMAVSLLAGSWFEISVFQTQVNVAMATAIILLAIYCLHSYDTIFSAINPLDVLITSMVVWHVVVDVYHGGGATIAAHAYGQWMLPYAAGRYTFFQIGSLSKLSLVFTVMATFISLSVVFESFTSVNIWTWLFTEADDEVGFNAKQRYDLLYRAMGPVRHPIFLGTQLLLLLPFVIDLGCQLRSSLRNSAITGIASGITLLGIVASVSRGPIISVAIAFLFALSWLNKTVRWIALAAVIILVSMIASNFDGFLELLDKTESQQRRGNVVKVNDFEEPEIYTGTRNRIFVLQIYGPIVIRGGLLGYGTEASSGFPPSNLPNLPTDSKTRQRLGVVDNSYINIGLRYGWVGLAIFIGILLTTLFLSLHLASIASTYFYPCDWRIMLAYASVFVALIFQIGTVFWSFDYAFWVLFQVGAISGLTSQVKRTRNTIEPSD
ncbi:O-antigen ligase family protein [Neorhodopirellula lusitana]|uniref:O-antigen ligase family protein n=1 Tax=Neorhodopirellula lusitana TaxID=445327 RepID=UPI00384CB183